MTSYYTITIPVRVINHHSYPDFHDEGGQESSFEYYRTCGVVDSSKYYFTQDEMFLDLFYGCTSEKDLFKRVMLLKGSIEKEVHYNDKPHGYHTPELNLPNHTKFFEWAAPFDFDQPLT